MATAQCFHFAIEDQHSSAGRSKAHLSCGAAMATGVGRIDTLATRYISLSPDIPIRAHETETCARCTGDGSENQNVVLCRDRLMTRYLQ
jgi:hypothetical protein